MISIKLITLVGILSLLLIICVAVSSSPTGDEIEKSEVEQIKEVSSARGRFTFEKLFNFDNYLKEFGKKYSSAVEQIVRMKTYLANAFKVFVSMISYKQHRSSSYLQVNEMSDWTPEEVKLIFADGSIETEAAEKLQAKDLTEFEEVSPEVSSEQEPKSRRKRSVVGPEKSANNMNFKFLQQGGFAFGHQPKQQKLLRNFYPIHKADEVFVDHRKGGCITPVRNQAKCGSCYAFATVALYEWLLCNQTGVLTEFSEQYMVDCGHLAGDHMFGCKGGFLKHAGTFVNNFGLELRKNYKYNAKLNRCPIEDPLPTKNRMGYVRMNVGDLEWLTSISLERALNYGPLISVIAVAPTFHQYGGGVDDNAGCDAKKMHAMLIVGRGREDGKEYWLYKNSFDTDWGLQGYYKMNRANNCTLDNGAAYFAKAKYLEATTGINLFKAYANPHHYLYGQQAKLSN